MKQVLKINLDGSRIVCTQSNDRHTPYRIHRISGGHSRLLAKCEDFVTVLCFLVDYYRFGADTLNMQETVQWAQETALSR